MNNPPPPSPPDSTCTVRDYSNIQYRLSNVYKKKSNMQIEVADSRSKRQFPRKSLLSLSICIDILWTAKNCALISGDV